MATDAMTLIRHELSKLSWKTKREFEKFFPCLNPKNIMEIFHKEYLEEQERIERLLEYLNKDLDIPARKLNFIEEEHTPEYLEYENLDELLERWTRFKKFRAFL